MSAMIFYNDLSTLHYLNVKSDRARDVPHDIANYNRHWTLRMLNVSLAEALKLIDTIQNSSLFERALRQPQVSECLKKLKPILPGGSEHHLFQSRIGAARDWIGAHVDERVIERAMRFRATSMPKRNVGKIELSTDPWCTRMYVAEDVITTVMVRFAWNLMEEGEELEKRGEELGLWFITQATFVQEFFLAFIISLKQNRLI